jgi:H+/Cl- antiporter ClcA
VSVAFGAPVGGTLFAYEMSRPNTFWRFAMIWKVFLSCSLTCFFLAFWENVVKGNFTGSWSGSALKFGSLKKSKEVNALFLMPAAIFIGIAGGCLGAFFINVNTRMAGIRKKCLKTKWIKPVETFCWCFVTASFFFWMPYAVQTCNPVNVLKDETGAFIQNITDSEIDKKKDILF